MIARTKEQDDKMVELAKLFKDVSVDTIKSMLSSDAGRLAHSVLINDCNSVPVRILIDELVQNWLTSDSGKEFVTRQALINELEDVLKAKSITPYRRSRINKALKRACIKCHGGGKEPIVKHSDNSRIGGIFTGRRTIKHEIDSRSPDCMHCKGTGINPKEATVVVAGIELTKAQLEQIESIGSSEDCIPI